MLDASNYDPRPLRIRIMETLSHPQYLSTAEMAVKLNTAHYTVSAMMSKMFLYGAPIERSHEKARPGGGRKYGYRLKPKGSP